MVYRQTSLLFSFRLESSRSRSAVCQADGRIVDLMMTYATWKWLQICMHRILYKYVCTKSLVSMYYFPNSMEKLASYLSYFSISFEKITFYMYWNLDSKSWIVDFFTRFTIEKTLQNNINRQNFSVKNNYCCKMIIG